jgi:hypothetical protein
VEGIYDYGKHHWEDIGVGGSIILECILGKFGGKV